MEAMFKFFSPSTKFDTEKPYELYLDQNPSNFPLTNCEFVDHEIILTDIRSLGYQPTLEEDGFRVLQHASSVMRAESDVKDDVKVQDYLEEVIQLVKKECAADKVICYDWRFRTSQQNTAFQGDLKDRIRPLEPAQRVHIDNSEKGAIGHIYRYLTTEELAHFRDKSIRIRLVNLWRPLCPIVEQWPLALCDRRTVEVGDQIEIDRPASRFVDYGCYVKHNPMQKWYWLPRQSSSEPFMFLVWDSESGNGAPHGAFRNPQASDTISRRSIEVRLLVLDKIKPANE